jgi:hypothetical protein
MTRPHWYSGYQPVTLLVPVEGGTHRVSWYQGRLTLHDHDLELEAVLGALGGEACTCLSIRNALRASPQAVRAFQMRPRAGLGSAPPAARAAQIRLLRQQARGATGAQVNWAAFGSEDVQRAWRAILSAMAVVRLERQRAQSTEPPTPAAARLSLGLTIEFEAKQALLLAMQESLPYLWPQGQVRVAIWIDAPEEPRVLQGDFTSRGWFVAVSLPIHWLTRVLRRGLACVDGAFVVDADAPTPARDVLARIVRWERRSGGHWVPVSAICAIERRDGRWQVKN